MKYILLAFSLLLLGCSKEGGDSSTGGSNNSSYWKVKYEVSSTLPDTKTVIGYRTESGTLKTVGTDSNPVLLPWSYEANFTKDPGVPNKTTQVLIGGLTTGQSGYVLSLKIYVDGKNVVDSKEGIAQYNLR